MPTTRELLDLRYGSAHDLPARDALNPVLETILTHRSVRAFLPDALEPGTLELLIAAAQSAPSSSNLQLWSVVAVEDRERKERVAKLVGNQQHVREAPLFLAFLADTSRLAEVAAQQSIPSDGLPYLDTFLMGAIDAALAAQTAVIAAESLGLGTVYIGALRNQPEQVAAELGLRPGVSPIFGLVVGKPDPARPTAIKPRLPQRAVAFREQYASHDLGREVARYDEVMRAFYAAQKLDQPSWSKHASERVRSPERLNGRHRLREALAALGFPLL
ncbi:MAG TPA: NADPH-dependent oxidoreductase [Polyangiales bacterium]